MPAAEPSAPASASGSEGGSDVIEDVELLKGWRTNDGILSLPEVNGSIAVPASTRPWFAQLAAFAGVGSMISVGYMVHSQLCVLIVGRYRMGLDNIVSTALLRL